MKKILKFNILKENHGCRIDIFLDSMINSLSRTKLKNLINDGFLKINDKIIKAASKKIKINDKIILKLPEPKETKILPFDFPLNILYEDKDLILINKPAGITVHPGAGNYNNTLVNALLHYGKENLSSVGGGLRPGIVHRIDKDTSGVIVIAKNDKSHLLLSKQFANHSIERKYEALVWNSLRPQKGKISTNIIRSKKNRQLMEVSLNKGKRAVTNYRTLEIFQNKNIPKISLVECKLETGRTHQIRVHMSYVGNSIVGDQIYGKKKKKFKKIDHEIDLMLKRFNRQALHAKYLGFIHPKTGKKVSFEASRPEDFAQLIKKLKKSTI